jgi:hypothetical protein
VQASDPRIHPNPGHQGAAAGAAAAANADHIETDDRNESEDVSASDLVDVLRLTKRSTAKKPAWSGLHGHGPARSGGGPVSGDGEVAGHDKFIAIEGALLSIEANWTTRTTQWDRPARSARMVRKSIAEQGAIGGVVRPFQQRHADILARDVENPRTGGLAQRQRVPGICDDAAGDGDEDPRRILRW